MLKRFVWSKNVANCVQTVVVFRRNAGHSKWANIKHIKAEKDAQKSLMMTRLSRQIKVAIQEGGSTNPNNNLKLYQIVEQAKRLSMPVASIQNVIKSTQVDREQCRTYLLEIKGPGGCIVLVEAFSSNLTATKQNLASIIKKHKSAFSDGGGRHVFEHKGIVETTFPADVTEANVLEIATNDAILVGAEDVVLTDDKTLEFVCDPTQLPAVIKALEEASYRVISGSAEHVPHARLTVALDDDELKSCLRMYEKLDGLNDVVRIFDNVR